MSTLLNNDMLASCKAKYETAIDLIHAERTVRLDFVDLGSAEINLIRDESDMVHLVCHSSSGEAINIPVAFFSKFM